MHSIRAQARRTAFNASDSDYHGFNPFARASARRRRTFADQENATGLSRIRAEHNRTSSPVGLEAQRRTRADDTEASCSSAHQEKTFPAGPDEISSATPLERTASPIGSLQSHFSSSTESSAGRKSSRLVKLWKWLDVSSSRYPIGSQLRLIFADSWFHLLLLLIPVGFALYYCKLNPVAVFFINFAAMIPSVMVLALAIDDIILRFGEVIGGLLSMTFSNASQLITSILLLRSRQIVVLQTSLVGAILSNLLLMPGLCFFFGGLNRMEQYFNITVAQTTSGLLLVAILALLIPTAAEALANTTHRGVVRQSRGASIVLLVCYILFMFFQLRTHADMYNEPSAKVPKRKSSKKDAGEALKGIASIGAGTGAAMASGRRIGFAQEEDDDEEIEEPQLPLLTAILVAAIFTTLLTFNTLFATNSIQGLLKRLDISETFLGIVILPILSNDPTTIIVAVKDKQDLAICLTLGKCVQIALLVLPFIVLLAWWMGINSVTLSFGNFETVIMLASVLIVNYIIQDGKSHWLIGALLVAAYIIVSVSAYYIPIPVTA